MNSVKPRSGASLGSQVADAVDLLSQLALQLQEAKSAGDALQEVLRQQRAVTRELTSRMDALEAASAGFDAQLRRLDSRPSQSSRGLDDDIREIREELRALQLDMERRSSADESTVASGSQRERTVSTEDWELMEVVFDTDGSVIVPWNDSDQEFPEFVLQMLDDLPWDAEVIESDEERALVRIGQSSVAALWSEDWLPFAADPSVVGVQAALDYLAPIVDYTGAGVLELRQMFVVTGDQLRWHVGRDSFTASIEGGDPSERVVCTLLSRADGLSGWTEDEKKRVYPFHRKRWDADHENRLLKHFNELRNLNDIAAALGRTPGSVLGRLAQLEEVSNLAS